MRPFTSAAHAHGDHGPVKIAANTIRGARSLSLSVSKNPSSTENNVGITRDFSENRRSVAECSGGEKGGLRLTRRACLGPLAGPEGFISRCTPELAWPEQLK